LVVVPAPVRVTVHKLMRNRLLPVIESPTPDDETAALFFEAPELVMLMARPSSTKLPAELTRKELPKNATPEESAPKLVTRSVTALIRKVEVRMTVMVVVPDEMPSTMDREKPAAVVVIEPPEMTMLELRYSRMLPVGLKAMPTALMVA